MQPFLLPNYSLLVPEFVLTAWVFAVLGVDLFLPREHKHLLSYLSIIGLLVVMVVAVPLPGNESLYGGLILVDTYAIFFKFFFPLVGIFILIISRDFVRLNLRYAGEYYGLILISILAMMLMSAAGEIITAYISLELLNFSLYTLASYAKDNPKSNEAGVKYILLSAFASALLLYGLSLLYGLTGTTTFTEIAAALQARLDPSTGSGQALQPGLLVALVLVTAGLGFKVAAVPFHMWAPDVYEGAPLPVTAYLAVASKAAGFALVLRLFSLAFMPVADDWRPIIAVLAALTMTVGNLVAIQQRNIKRMLAYSSISQVGYLLVGIAAMTPLAASAILLHLAGYAVSNLAGFLAITVYYNLTGKEEIPDYAGLAERAPFVALSLAVALFSLAGMPLFAGFTSKFYLFTAAAKAGLLWLAAIAITNSLVSLYYYLVVVRQMYIAPPPELGRYKVPGLTTGALAVLVALVILFGVYPAPLVRIIDAAIAALPL